MAANMLNHLHENDVDVQFHLKPLVEHRIKLLLKQTVNFHAGELQNVETSCILDDIKTRTRLCLTLKQYEHLPLHLNLEEV